MRCRVVNVTANRVPAEPLWYVKSQSSGRESLESRWQEAASARLRVASCRKNADSQTGCVLVIKAGWVGEWGGGGSIVFNSLT